MAQNKVEGLRDISKENVASRRNQNKNTVPGTQFSSAVLFGNTGSTDLLTSGFTHEFDKFSITIFIATLWVLWIHEFLSNKWIHDFQRVPAGTLWKLWIKVMLIRDLM